MKLILTILGAVMTTVVVPWIKANVDKNKLDKLQVYTEYAVRYAEQMYKTQEFKQKKEYVYNYILEKAKLLGLSLTNEDINVIVEGVVNYVKYGYEE